MKRFQILVLLGVLSLGVVAADVPAVFDVWRQPQVWPRHMQLRNEFLNAIRRGDTKAMEASSRVTRADLDCPANPGFTPADYEVWFAPKKNSTLRKIKRLLAK